MSILYGLLDSPGLIARGVRPGRIQVQAARRARREPIFGETPFRAVADRLAKGVHHG